MARASRALPRPRERLPEGRERTGARARAEAAPGAETLQAGNRKAHREARAAGDEEDRLDPREPSYPRRSRARSTFPRWVRGSASRKITSRGYLYGSSRPRTKACSSSAKIGRASCRERV